MSDVTDQLLLEYERSLAYSDSLWHDLDDDQLAWRPHADFSPIGWHLGHQAAVAHYLLRNLVAAEPSAGADLDALFDSASALAVRDALPGGGRLGELRTVVADRVRVRVAELDRSAAPNQLRLIVDHLLVSITNHEYQHAQWISEVRADELGLDLPARPTSPLLADVDGYLVVDPAQAR